MKNLAVLLSTLIIGSCSAPTVSDKPNVLLILSDDQGSIDLNCYGANDLQTPNLDKLANGGVRFTQFYAAASVCSPSRAALLTGKTNLKAGLPGNVPIPEYQEEGQKAGLPTDQITIAEMLQKNEYSTALVGKWHLGHSPEQLPNGQGFDHFFGHQRGCIDNYSHFFYWRGPNRHDLYRNDEEVFYPGRNFGDLMVEEILELLNKKQEKPFFIYWAFNAPHYPYQGTVEWQEYYKDHPYPRNEYAAFVSSMDEKIGIVLNELDKLGLSENTIVIFQSDQGHSTEERAHWGGGNAGPYRGCKFSFFEGGIRVPAIIRYPGVIPQNEVRDQLTSEMDWLPTIAELTGSKILDEGIEGKSLMPVIEDAGEKSQHEILYWQQGDYSGSSPWAVREGEWKLLGNPEDRSSDQLFTGDDTLYLVNLKKDVSEKNNLASQYPDEVQRLKSLHLEWLSKVKKERNQ